MARPRSINNFERLYLGSLVVWTLGLFVAWPLQKATLLTNPAIASNPAVAGLIDTILIGSTILVAAATLLFWFLVVRQASVIGKWLVVVTESLGALLALFSLFGLVSGRAPSSLVAVISLITSGLGVAAAVMLLRPDANAWFDRRAGAGVGLGETFR